MKTHPYHAFSWVPGDFKNTAEVLSFPSYMAREVYMMAPDKHSEVCNEDVKDFAINSGYPHKIVIWDSVNSNVFSMVKEQS